MNKVKAIYRIATWPQISKFDKLLPYTHTGIVHSAVRPYSRIYTRTGDGGRSSLFTGERRKKSDDVFHALGDIDELSCHIGFAREILAESWQQENFEGISDMLQKIQCVLQDVASCVATPVSTATDKQKNYTAFDKELVDELEKWIDAYVKDLPELKNFILPSGGKSSCVLHMARSICRRAERKVAVLHESNDVTEDVIKYVNRLSDFLFTVARYAASMEGNSELIYKRRKPGDSEKDIHDMVIEASESASDPTEEQASDSTKVDKEASDSTEAPKKASDSSAESNKT